MSGNKFKIGICEWSIPVEGPEVCEFAAKLGLEGIQLEIGSHEADYPLSNEKVQQAYLELAGRHGLEFTSIAVRVTDDFSITKPIDSKDHAIVTGAVVRAIDAARAMNISTIMIPSFLESDIVTANDLSRTAQVLQFACDYALSKKITVATENLLLPESMDKLSALVDRPNLKLYFDTQNYYAFKGYNPASIIGGLASMFCQEVHVKDGIGGQISSALLGEGDSGFVLSINALKRTGYSGWLIIENYYDRGPLSERNENPAELIKSDYQALLRAIS